jgi:CCR4-NOT transcription complex subunit 6
MSLSVSVEKEFLLKKGPGFQGVEDFRGLEGYEYCEDMHSSKISVLQYNVLAESYAFLNIGGEIKLGELSWENRSAALLDEILSYDADIICLQEVDHFYDFFYPELKNHGYEGIFKKRPTRQKRDGCAIFYNRDRFVSKDKDEVCFNNVDADLIPSEEAALASHVDRENESDSCEENCGEDAHVSRFHTNNIALGIYLCEKHRVDEIGSGFWVFNTHLFWNPQYEDVKLVQTKMLLRMVQRAVLSKKGGIILCGDFNATPDSRVYKLVSTYEDTNDSIDQIYPLRSAYKEIHGSEPSFTNYTHSFQGCLDYIWFSSDVLLPRYATDLPSIDELESFIPNRNHASDHLALYCEFEWKNNVPCRYGVQCRRTKCRYYHPCLCRFGNKCLKINAGCKFSHVVPCKYGVSCTKLDCQFNHLPCKFGSFCSNKSCVYSHLISCKFGDLCARADCRYFHPRSKFVSPSNREGNSIAAMMKTSCILDLIPSLGIDSDAELSETETPSICIESL